MNQLLKENMKKGEGEFWRHEEMPYFVSSARGWVLRRGQREIPISWECPAPRRGTRGDKENRKEGSICNLCASYHLSLRSSRRLGSVFAVGEESSRRAGGAPAAAWGI